MGKKQHRVFLDSNIILSGLFSAEGASRLVLDVLGLGLPILAGVTGRFNLAEIERELGEKIPDALPVYLDELPLLNLEIVPMPSTEDLRARFGAAKGKDLPVLASAIAARADFFVTVDKKLIDLIDRMGGLPLRAASPGRFLDEELPKILKER